MQLSIVIPVHNEEANIGSLLSEIHGCLGNTKHYEIICVDDQSTDHTARVIAEHAEILPDLRYILLPGRSGQSCGLRTGVQAARSSLVISLDGDGQNDPSDIPAFFSFLKEKNQEDHNSLVIGHRQQRQDSYWRRFTSKVANAFRNLALGDNTPDSGCGIKAFNREVFLELPAFNHMHRFLPALFHQHGGAVFSLPVNHRARQNGSSNYGTIDRLCAGVVDIPGVMWLRYRSIQISSSEAKNAP